jgi:hypothetical protein
MSANRRSKLDLEPILPEGEACPFGRIGPKSSLGRQTRGLFCVSTARKWMSEHPSESVSY